MPASSSSDRRIVAIVLPDLLCEMVEAKRSPRVRAEVIGRKSRSRSGSGRRRPPPLGVVLVDAEEGAKTETLSAVNTTARQYGVRPGQTLAEAHALVAKLVIREVSKSNVERVLGHVAEMALVFGTTASIEAPDTVWLDVTGASHLVGGDEALALELAARVREMGHLARVCVSCGPRLGQAFARWSTSGLTTEGTMVVPAKEARDRVARLPALALPLDAERASWLVRLGIHTIGDVRQLPRAAAASRLGEQAPLVLDLAEGKDHTPLVAYEPPRVPSERVTWEDPVEGSEPLLFVLRGIVSRLSARLEGRGESAQKLRLIIEHDQSIAKLRGVEPKTALSFDLAAPLWRSEELWRVVSSKVQKTRLGAPSLGVALEAPSITQSAGLQLDLSRGASGLSSISSKGPETLPVLLAELAADIGKKRFGILEVENSHRPEAKSRLVPVDTSKIRGSLVRTAKSQKKDAFRERLENENAPTRLLSRPVPLDAPIRIGAAVSIDHHLYSIERIEFEHRLDGIEWWTDDPVARDYLRLWLSSATSGAEAIVYVNRETGTRFLQALYD